MKVKANIEIWDNTTLEYLEQAGGSKELAYGLYKAVFTNYVKDIAERGGCEWSVDVKVEENV